MAVVTLAVVVGGYVAIKMMAGQSQQKLDGFLQTGQSCFDTRDFACALDNAGLALQQDSNDPRALSLLQRAQAAQAAQVRQQQLQDAAQKQQLLKAQSAEAARQADALREQQALERQRQEAADRQVHQQQQQAAKAVNASLQQAQNALNAGEYQSAIAVARVVLGMDPNNSRARNIIRQAEQQLKEALNRTRIE